MPMKPSQDQPSRFDEGLILSDLERRFYLYLIGGDYEKLFYVYDERVQIGEEYLPIERILLDIEVSKEKREHQATGQFQDPVYKGMLDFMLKSRINNKLEQQADLFAISRHIRDIVPIIREMEAPNGLTRDVIEYVASIDWFCDTLRSMLRTPDVMTNLSVDPDSSIPVIIKELGMQNFMWLVPKCFATICIETFHPSLRKGFGRLKAHLQYQVGAASALALDSGLPVADKQRLHQMVSIGGITLSLLYCLINHELNALIEQQTEQLKRFEDKQKHDVLDNYELAGDAIIDVLSMEEILKPSVLEAIGFNHFDPVPYVFGYAENNEANNILQQSRAYALYRQLYRTGRIHTAETAFFLKRNGIDKRVLNKLNDANVTEVSGQLQVLKALFALKEGQPAKRGLLQ